MDDDRICAADTDRCKRCQRTILLEKRKEKYVCPFCGANTRCFRKRVKRYEFCYKHGGPTPDKNEYGDGDHMTLSSSQFPITRLADRYRKMMKSGRFLSNRQSLAVVRQRIVELMQRVEESKDPDRVQTLFKLWEKFKDADALDAFMITKEIDNEFKKAYDDYRSWDQMERFLDLDRKMVESEVKIAKDLRAILTAEDAYQLTAKIWGSVMDAVRQSEVPDKSKSLILKRIEYEIVNIIGEDSRSGESDEDFVEGSFGEVLGGSGEDGVPRPGGLDGDEFLHPRDEE